MNEKKKEKLRGRLSALVDLYRRKCMRRFIEYDQHQSRKLEKRMKKMKPEELDELLNE